MIRIEDRRRKVWNVETRELVGEYSFVYGFMNGFAVVTKADSGGKNPRQNWIKEDDGSLISDVWYPHCYHFGKYGLAPVLKTIPKAAVNWVDKTGKVVFEWGVCKAHYMFPTYNGKEIIKKVGDEYGLFYKKKFYKILKRKGEV